MKSVFKYICIVLLTAAALVSCVKEKQTTLPPGTFIIDTDAYSSIPLTQDAQVAFVPVTTNIPEDEWQFSSNADWCRIGRSLTAEKGVMISVDSNTDKEEMRRAEVGVTAGSNDYKIAVIQTGYGPSIIVKDASIGPEGGRLILEVMSNVSLNEALIQAPEFDKADGENWIRFVGKGGTKGFATAQFSFDIDVNEMPSKRVATIQLKASDSADSKADTKCVITQNSISVTSTEVFTDTKVAVVSVKDNQPAQSQWSEGFGALIDGNATTFYHSLAADENGGTVFPLAWDFELNGNERVDYISIRHRNNGASYHYRGQIGEFNVYAKNDGDADWKFVQKFDFGGRGGYQTANLDTPVPNARWIRIEILNGDPNSGSYTDGPYICCGEVEFYNSNRAEVNEWISKIFTDLSCSELKAGVTKQDIIKMNAVAPYLAVNVAMPLFDGSYTDNEKDFRIHEYEPYSDNHVNRALVLQFYTAMDNPTGIEVHAGKDIIVCVDQIPEGQSVSLAIYGESDEYGPNYGGGGESEGVDQLISLQAGINNIRITSDGMAYVMNTVPVENRADLSTFKSVKVHILPGCGTLQGYFDPKRHSDERYKELLNKCTYKYFLVKGERCMFLFHTKGFRSYFPNSIRGGIEAWDQLVLWELELLGLDNCKWFNNHMMAVTNTNPDVYMNASNRRVQFGLDNAISQTCNPDRLKEEEEKGVANIWGPAHEMGHVNQMAINWRSTTESSNNLFSNYANLKLAGDEYYKTRWSRGEKLDMLAGEYAKKMPWVELGLSYGDYQGENSGLHMRLNWQLWNYYHNCGVKSNFFPALFNYFRDGHQLPNQSALDYYGKAENAGLCQLQYYEACCYVAGEDLTDFFDAWGFFRTYDKTLDQYGTAKYTVTDAMINASKARVRDMNLPKAAPIQYLEDRATFGGTTYSQMGYWTQFRDKVKISKTPSAKVSGSKVTLSDCDEAVSVEVRRGTAETGELLFFSNMFSFTVPSGVSLSGNTLWAVQSDGKRVKINL